MDKVTLNNKEQKRVIVVNEILAGRLTGQEAAELLGISLTGNEKEQGMLEMPCSLKCLAFEFA